MGACGSCVSRVSLLLLSAAGFLLFAAGSDPLPARTMRGARQLAFSALLRTPPRGPGRKFWGAVGVPTVVHAELLGLHHGQRRRGAPGVRCAHSGGDSGGDEGSANQGRFKLFYNDVYEVSKPTLESS